MNFKSDYRSLAVFMAVFIGSATLLLAGVLAFVNHYESIPPKFSTVCVGEETMVIYSDKGDHFTAAYGAKCK